MSLKRSTAAAAGPWGGSDGGAKVGRQELYDELQEAGRQRTQAFTPVDVALSIGAGEPQVSRALLGLAAEGCLEKVELGKYRVTPMFADLTMPEFLKVVHPRLQDRLHPAAGPVGDRPAQAEQRHHAGQAAGGDRRARPLPGGAEAHNIDPGPAPVPAASAPVAAEPAAAANRRRRSREAAEPGSDDPPTGLA